MSRIGIGRERKEKNRNKNNAPYDPCGVLVTTSVQACLNDGLIKFVLQGF